MRFNARHLYRYVLVGGALVALSCAPGGAWAQQSNNNNQDQDQAEMEMQSISRADLAAFDQFLDAHPDVARNLQENPSLASDATFLNNHTQLKDFLSAHTQIGTELNTSPSRFMDQISVFERTETDHAQDNRERNPNRDLTRAEVATADKFFDSHPDIEKQLEANPRLINNQDFLQDHPQLQDFLKDHPQVHEEFTENPGFFMKREGQFENSPADRAADNGQINRGRNPNPDLTQGEVANMDQFLDQHPDITKKLEADPSLINNQQFLSNAPELQAFFKAHPRIQEEFAETPKYFENELNRFESSEADRPGEGGNRGVNPNPDLTRGEIATADQFLDQHPDIEKQLEANPSLIKNQDFLQDHPQLQNFLSSHPRIQEEFAENPTVFMNRENRFENSPADRDGRVNPNPDLTRGEVASMDQFLDQHPEITKKLEADPSLINNQQFLSNAPELQAFFKTHPRIQEEFAETPKFFENELSRFESSEADRPGEGGNRGVNPNPDLTRGEVASMDQFLDQHPEIEKQLEANPSLINNSKYLNDHSQLRAFLSDHPEVREEFTENPSFFMQRENRFENTEDNSKGVETMDAYLDKHPDVARDLDAYPARVNDSDYLVHHKDLDNFLKKHPEVREQFSHNPSAFMHQESAFDASAEMNDFLDNHKSVRKDLDQNPESVKDDDYLNYHNDLKTFLSKNPGVGDQFQNNPRGFMDNERKFDADRQMDFYLTKHKNVAKDLQKNPDRVKDVKYLDHHKDLKDLMDKHPELAEAAHTNPTAFMQEQMKFHEQYKNQHVQEKTRVEERAKTHGAQ